jgi:hypothetical protein
VRVPVPDGTRDLGLKLDMEGHKLDMEGHIFIIE